MNLRVCLFVPLLTAAAQAQTCPGTWSPLTTGFFGAGGLTLAANGNTVYAGGGFTSAGGVPAQGIARWENGAWSSLAGGIQGPIYSIAFLPNGDVLAAGNFGQTVSMVQCNHIARWDGTAWHSLAQGLLTESHAVIVLTNGDAVVGGGFTALGTGANGYNYIARWDGAAWSPLGSGMGGQFASVTSLLALPDGGFVAGGQFTTAGGITANRIARWSPAGGGAWSSLGSGPNNGMNNDVMALARLQNGDIVAGGGFTTVNGVPTNFISRWNGTTWNAMGAGVLGQVSALSVLLNGDLIVAGGFTSAGGSPANRVARWNIASGWSAIGAGLDNLAYGGTTTADGRILVDGAFLHAGGVSVNFIAEYRPACYGNCDCSTTSPALTANDFQCFLNAYASGSTNANCDNSTSAPILTANDFQCFLNQFASGCS